MVILHHDIRVEKHTYRSITASVKYNMVDPSMQSSLFMDNLPPLQVQLISPYPNPQWLIKEDPMGILEQIPPRAG